MEVPQPSAAPSARKQTQRSSKEWILRRVLLVSHDAALRERMVKLLRSRNYDPLESGPAESLAELLVKCRPDLIVIADSQEAAWTEQIGELARHSELPPVVVFSSVGEETSQHENPDSVVFARFSLGAASEDQLSVLAAAARYSAVRKENQMLRREIERLCWDLLRALGETTEKLQKRTKEVRQIQSLLREAQARILKAFT